MWPCKWLLEEIMCFTTWKISLAYLIFQDKEHPTFGFRIPDNGLLDPDHTGCWEPIIDIFSHLCAQLLHKSVIVGSFTLHHRNNQLAPPPPPPLREPDVKHLPALTGIYIFEIVALYMKVFTE